MDEISRYKNAGASIRAPREYRQTLSTLINGLVEQGFIILHLEDQMHITPDPQAEPGTWNHFVAFAPPWLALWTRYAPEGCNAEK